MEFWGAEVKPGESVKAKPDAKKLINVSQVALGYKEDNKGVDSVSLHMKVNDVKFRLGTLSAKNRPQMILDLVFEKEFELSHDWEDGSVYFFGYKRDNLYPNACPSGHNLEEEKDRGQNATIKKEAKIVDPREDEESDELEESNEPEESGSSDNDLSSDDESTSGSDESDESTSEEDEDVQISFSYAPSSDNDLSSDDESTSGSDESDESTSEEDEDVQISFSYAPFPSKSSA